MIPRTPLLLAAACAALAPFTVRAAEAAAKLDTGSAAPEYKPTAWIQGAPVTGFEKGKTYLLECWATWCGPCVAQIPHLNALHKKYAGKGLVVVGNHVWERDGATPETVAAFVKAKGEDMSYRIAFDARLGGEFTAKWLIPAGVNGIPHAFVVRDGVIIWHGHPAHLNDATIESMLAGTFDAAKAAAEQKAATKAENETRAKITAAQRAIGDAIKAKDYDTALAKVDTHVALLPERSRPLAEATGKSRVYLAKGDIAQAVATMDAARRANPGDNLLNINLLMLVTAHGGVLSDKAGAKLAAGLADAVAADAQLGKHPMVLMLIAQVRYASGDKAGAQAALKSAAAVADSPDSVKASIAKAIAAVEAGDKWPSGR